MKSKISFAVLGALLGMIAVSCWIGGVIAWQQSSGWPRWLVVPLGVGAGPMYLLLDLSDVIEGKIDGMTALPQSLIGGGVGAVIGWMIAHIRSLLAPQPAAEKD
ncbi:hypothetical protein GM658_16325 [Pseudoduganella eburnea]|uniref:Lipoprotein n=1 Tax=Massilia eburnea TaxID=1776165 RepID=A0A6L6QID8_9BURK|nr:hypothetical protein [Massilia eburnea]MTW12172.1 hypothetical protein [Massilia eburnea]